MSAQPSWQDIQPAWYDESTASLWGSLGREDGDVYEDAYLDDEDDDEDEDAPA